MFKLSNLRKESENGWTFLKCDFQVTEINNPFQEKSIWISVRSENADMLSDRVYDPFLLVPTILGMYYKQDVYVEGNVSARLYHNITHYLMNIFDRFSDHTMPIKLVVSGFDTVEEGPSNLIGTGISCGVDSLLG